MKSFMNGFPYKPQKVCKSTICGILNPVYWDSHGRPSQFAIYNEVSGEDYIIVGHHSPKNLRGLLNRTVIAKGFITDDPNEDEKLIKASTIRAVPGPASPALALSPEDKELYEEDLPLHIPKGVHHTEFNQDFSQVG